MHQWLESMTFKTVFKFLVPVNQRICDFVKYSRDYDDITEKKYNHAFQILKKPNLGSIGTNQLFLDI